jgi:PilZ domain-containing protein
MDRFPPQGWVGKVQLPRTFMGLGGGDSINAPIVDLSETGARMLLPQKVDKGQQIRVRIQDPKFKDVIEWVAVVVWVNPPPPVATTWVVGIEFVELPREHKSKIQGWRSYYTSDEYRKSIEDPQPIRETQGRLTRSRKATRPDEGGFGKR